MRKILMLILPLCICFATNAQPVNPKAVDDSILKVINSSAASISIDPVGYVNDFEHLLDSTQIKQLTRLIVGFEAKTTNEIAVVTISDFNTYGNDIEAFSKDLFNSWGIGKKDKNNGMLIVVSANKRLIRISTGMGINTTLTDDMGDHIINDIMIPEFIKKDYATGITNGVVEIIKILDK
jgi:uncharacterized protein